MKLETAIASWREWRVSLQTRPQVVGELDGGRSNRSYLLDSDGTRMVLRLNNQQQLLPSADHLTEAKIWQAASDKGIAPPLLYVDERAGFLVSVFIDDDVSSRAPGDEAVFNQALELIRQCHSLEVEAPTLDYRLHIESYWQLIKQSGKTPANRLLEQRDPIQKRLESLLKSNPRTGLCHHDPVRANFVGTAEKLYLIDWEYAARGLVVMDYAALGVEWGIGDEVIVARAGIETESLVMAKEVYGYLCSLWGVISG